MVRFSGPRTRPGRLAAFPVRRVVAWGVAIASFAAAMAGPVATLDLTTRAEAEPRYLVFCGRDNSVTGHAFVVWGREEATPGRSVSDGAFGLYPQDDGLGNTVKLVFAAVPGRIAQEEIARSLTADLIRLIVRVDRDVYAATLARQRAWAARTDYQLLEQDCVSFVAEMAAATGLTLPPRARLDRPWAYVGKIVAANPQGNFFGGEWTSRDAARRFTLVIRGDECEWTERAAGGGTLVRRVAVNRQANGVTVARPNDEEVLRFLGFQPSLRTEILARGPLPSYLQLIRTGPAELRAIWFGLSVTKDENARLRELRQPGAGPGVEFIFAKP